MSVSPSTSLSLLNHTDIHPLGVTHEQFEAIATTQGTSPTLAREAYARFFRTGNTTGIRAVPAPKHVHTTPSDEGPVHKFLMDVAGRDSSASTFETESVVIPMRHRNETTKTLCVSSQVGCAMGCTFCETAQMGLMRSLSAAEIVAQWFAARHHLDHTIRNVVFMGMGEPLDNVEQVIQAIRVLTDHFGPSIAMRRITVSTVGRLNGLSVLREAVLQPGWRQLNLAVSVNAPNDEIRSEIMPINRAMPLDQLIPMLEDSPLRKTGHICAEYVLIPGVNDQDRHADELALRLSNVRCCVNVIPYNPRRDSPWPAPTEESVWRFLRRLESHGQFCKRRRTKGRDAMAACGQLGNENVRKRRAIAPSPPNGQDSHHPDSGC